MGIIFIALSFCHKPHQRLCILQRIAVDVVVKTHNTYPCFYPPLGFFAKDFCSYLDKKKHRVAPACENHVNVWALIGSLGDGANILLKKHVIQPLA